MSIEQDVFRKKTVKFDSLIPYGFTREDGGYTYSEELMEGEFRACVRISEDGVVTGKVMDIEADEEYLPVHIETRLGAYVSTVREAYGDVLRRIADACCVREPFLSEQSNRIARLIEARYGEKPDNPFKNIEDIGIFRWPDNRKWYGIIMNIREHLLTNEGKKDDEGSRTVEIMNVKVEPEKMDELLRIPGIYPSYHMNRANWITILLDGTVPDEKIMELVDVSRSFAINAGRKNGSSGEITKWIVPANPKYYDVEAAFKKSTDIIWKQSSNIHVGDTVYLYVAAPVSAVRYKCEVLEVNIPYEYRTKNVRMAHVMRIRLLKTYDPARFTFQWLKSIGINTVRGPRNAPPAFLKEVESE
jgi:predicted DNA-binding protein (MmcQ/YjbR family)